MNKPPFYALVRVPRLDSDQLGQFKREGIAPTFVKDCAPASSEPADVSIRIDAATRAEAGVRVIRATNNKARILHPPVRVSLMPMAGVTPVG